MTEKTLFLRGKLNEMSSFDFLSKEAVPNGTLILDFCDLESLNSCGLRSWITQLKNLDVKFIYRNCPVFLVSQFVMAPDLLCKNTSLESFQMPFYCYNCDEEDFLHIDVKNDVPDPKNFDPETVEAPYCPKCKSVMELDTEMVEDYSFLAKNQN